MGGTERGALGRHTSYWYQSYSKALENEIHMKMSSRTIIRENPIHRYSRRKENKEQSNILWTTKACWEDRLQYRA